MGILVFFICLIHWQNRPSYWHQILVRICRLVPVSVPLRQDLRKEPLLSNSALNLMSRFLAYRRARMPLIVYVIGVAIAWAVVLGLAWLFIGGLAQFSTFALVCVGFALGMLSMYISVHVYKT